LQKIDHGIRLGEKRTVYFVMIAEFRFGDEKSYLHEGLRYESIRGFVEQENRGSLQVVPLGQFQLFQHPRIRRNQIRRTQTTTRRRLFP